MISHTIEDFVERSSLSGGFVAAITPTGQGRAVRKNLTDELSRRFRGTESTQTVEVTELQAGLPREDKQAFLFRRRYGTIDIINIDTLLSKLR